MGETKMNKFKRTLVKGTIIVGLLGTSFAGGMWYFSQQADAKDTEVKEPVKSVNFKAQQIQASKAISERLRDEFRMGGPVNSFSYNFNSVDAFTKKLLVTKDDNFIEKKVKNYAKSQIGREYNIDLEAEYTFNLVSSDSDNEFVKVTQKTVTIYVDQLQLDFDPNYEETKFNSDVGKFLQVLQAYIPDSMAEKHPSLQFTYTEEDRKQLFLQSLDVGKKKLLTENKEEVDKLEKDTLDKISNFVSGMSEAEGKEVIVKKRYTEYEM